MADQFFSSMGNDTFKMDDLLADMRSMESRSREDAWPKQFINKIEKQVSILMILNLVIIFILISIIIYVKKIYLIFVCSTFCVKQLLPNYLN